MLRRKNASRSPVHAGPANVKSGKIAVIDDSGAPFVTYEGGPGPLRAALAVVADVRRLRRALDGGQTVLLAFVDGDPSLPVILGFLGETARVDAAGETLPGLELDVDGRRLRVSAQDEIVLRCGKASVTLRRNGRIILRGTHIESHSDGTNRIKGGQVKIN